MDPIGDAIKKATAHLTENPGEARYTDSAAVAVLDRGLKVTVSAPDGRSITTDMPSGVGGEDSAASPGWLFRAALAACDTTLIAMRAAMLSIELDSVEVTIDSESNDLGILGIDESVPPVAPERSNEHQGERHGCGPRRSTQTRGVGRCALPRMRCHEASRPHDPRDRSRLTSRTSS